MVQSGTVLQPWNWLSLTKFGNVMLAIMIQTLLSLLFVIPQCLITLLLVASLSGLAPVSTALCHLLSACPQTLWDSWERSSQPTLSSSRCLCGQTFLLTTYYGESYNKHIYIFYSHLPPLLQWSLYFPYLILLTMAAVHSPSIVAHPGSFQTHNMPGSRMSFHPALVQSTVNLTIPFVLIFTNFCSGPPTAQTTGSGSGRIKT